MSNQTTEYLTRYYDEVPYDSHPFPQSAVEHLATRAFLFGLVVPDVSRARVLELGCAGGGNLIPFASRYPGASAMGVDLSSVQIAQGQAAVTRAGLTNIDLRAMDMTGIDASLGQFDYIICHGVYSWVPVSVQEAILRICSENLSPDGVAYVSYNVYPGWKAREIVRDAMLLRGGARETPEEKLSFGRGMLEFLEQSSKPESLLRKALEETMPIIRGGNPTYLLHEFFEPVNEPCYFKEFLSRAEGHGLTYLAESETSSMFVQNYQESVREPLLQECGGSQVMMEQYLDFLVNRTFRQTLLVKSAKADQIRYRLDPERLSALHFAGAYVPVDGSALTLDDREQLCSASCNRSVTLRHPVHKAVASLLSAQFPATLEFGEIVGHVVEQLGESPVTVRALALAMLEELVILGAIFSRRDKPDIARDVSSHPRALDATCEAFLAYPHGDRPTSACNQWHEQATLSPLETFLLPLVDGSRSQDALEAEVTTAARTERLCFSARGQPIEAKDVSVEYIHEEMMLALFSLRRKGLLVS